MEKVATPDGDQALEDGRPVHLPRAIDQAQDADQRHQRPLLDARCARPLLERAQGPKYLVELPNAGHELKENREWATSGLGAFFHHVVLNRPLPRLTWDFFEGSGGTYRFNIRSTPAPQSARVWTARSGTRDFRESKWDSSPLTPGETMTYEGQPSTSGRVALLRRSSNTRSSGIPYSTSQPHSSSPVFDKK